MGLAAWHFLRSGLDELRPLSGASAECFISGGGRLPPEADGFVRYAQVLVRLQDRHPVEVVRVGFFQYRALADGTLDRTHFREIMALVGEATFGWLGTKPPQGVIGAEHRFARRRLDQMSQWKPTRGEQAKLRELVNKKAKRDLM